MQYMKEVIGVLVIICFATSGVLAQLVNIQGIDNVVVRTKKYSDIQGSAYVYPSWCSGTLTDNSGKTYQNVLLKYDTYKDLVEVNQDGQVIEVNATTYPKFTMDYTGTETNEVVKHHFASGFSVPGFPGYFDVLYTGRFSLLKKYKTSFVEETVTGYGTSNAYKRFQSKVHYFVVRPDNSIVEVKLNKKSILEELSDKSADVEEFVKDKKSKLKSESDLVELIKYLDADLGAG